MLELLAVGKLAGARAFPVNNVSAEQLDAVNFQFAFEEMFYLELIPDLTALGRLDLVRAIELKSKEFRKRQAWAEERDWKGAVKKTRSQVSGQWVISRVQIAARIRLD